MTTDQAIEKIRTVFSEATRGLSRADYREVIGAIASDMEAFEACLDDEEAIEAEGLAAEQAGEDL